MSLTAFCKIIDTDLGGGGNKKKPTYSKTKQRLIFFIPSCAQESEVCLAEWPQNFLLFDTGQLNVSALSRPLLLVDEFNRR